MTSSSYSSLSLGITTRQEQKGPCIHPSIIIIIMICHGGRREQQVAAKEGAFAIEIERQKERGRKKGERKGPLASNSSIAGWHGQLPHFSNKQANSSILHSSFSVHTCALRKA
jgi:hypothetical protein